MKIKEKKSGKGNEGGRGPSDSAAPDDKAASGRIHHAVGMCCSDTNSGPNAVGNEHTL